MRQVLIADGTKRGWTNDSSLQLKYGLWNCSVLCSFYFWVFDVRVLLHRGMPLIKSFAIAAPCHTVLSYVQLCIEARSKSSDSHSKYTLILYMIFSSAISDFDSFLLLLLVWVVVSWFNCFSKHFAPQHVRFFAAVHSLYWRKKAISAALAKCPKVYPLNCKCIDILSVPLG